MVEAARAEVKALVEQASTTRQGKTVSDRESLEMALADVDLEAADELSAAERVSDEARTAVLESLAKLQRTVNRVRANVGAGQTREAAEAQRRQEEDAKLPGDLPADLARDDYKALEGTPVSIVQDIVGGNGALEFEFDARDLMRSLDRRAESLRKLRACLEGK